MHKHFVSLLTIIFAINSAQIAKGLSFEGLEGFPEKPTAQNFAEFYYELKPGESISDTVKVKNNDENTLSIRVYAVDTEINNQGISILKSYTSEKQDFGTWVTFDNQTEQTFNLPPKSEKSVKFNISVPENTKYDKYSGGIMVEKLNTEEGKEIQENVVIKTNYRIGLSAKVNVTENPNPPEYIKNINQSPSWTQYYLIASIAIFAITLGIATIKSIKKKKAKKTQKS